MHLLIIFLCIYSVSTTINTWQNLYNCNFMNAAVFPVNKIILKYGPKYHQLRGKWWEDTQAQLPSCQQKVQQTWFMASLTIPKDPVVALQAFNQLRDQIYARGEAPQTEIAKTEFEEKVKLNIFTQILGKDVVADSFPFITSQYPNFWLNPDYSLFALWESMLLKHYERATRLRLIKIDSIDKDYCTELANSLEASPADWASGKVKDAFKMVFRCFDTFPHSAEAINELLSGSLMLNDLFVFNNISAPSVGSTKFFSFLKDQKVVFDSHFRWHDFIAKVLNALKDAHVSFKSDCYESFTYVQPIFLQKILRGDKEAYIITKANSVELNYWANAEVISIDSIEAGKIISTYAKTTGKCHESRARSVFVLSRKQWGGQDFRLERGLYLKRTTLPDRPFIVYTLKRPDTNYLYEVKVDWMIFKGSALNGFNDQYSYWKNNCAAKPFKRKQALPPPPALRKRTITKNTLSSHDHSTASFEKRDAVSRPTSEGVTPITVGPGFAFFTFVDDNLGSYAVLVIQTFEVGDMEGWFQGMRAGFQKLIQAGIKNLLLDLSGNTGGVLCLAYSLLGVLSPSAKYPFPATKYAYGTRVNPSETLKSFSKCVDEANIKGSPFKLQTFKNLTCNCDFAPDLDWSVEGYSTYSTFLLDRCDLKYSPLLEDVKPDFDTIIVLSDGLCGSSCAIVSLYLQQNGSPGIAISLSFTQDKYSNENVTSVYPLGLFAFAGGQVVNYENLKDVAKRSSCYDLVPKLLERIQVTFTYRAIFNLKDTKNPLEFCIIPANMSINYTDEFIDSISARWKKAFPIGIDILRNPDKYPRIDKPLFVDSPRYSFIDMMN